MHTTRTGDRRAPRGQSGAISPSAAPTADHEAAPPARLAVDVTGLRCAYGEFEAVRGVDLTARRGELLAVLGTNGAGKTTTLDALEGRRAPDAGRVRVLGLDPYRQRRTLASRAGTMLQDVALPDELTPTELLELWQRMAGGGSLSHRPAGELLARVGLTERADVRIGRLSGGERRRLDLAVALSADPELLFLDEPTAGLDPESRADAWELIRALLRAGTTVVLTTHYLEEAEALADRLAIMHAGRVEVAGRLSDVLAARHARIRCELDPAAVVPTAALTGQATCTRERGVQQVEVRTPDLAVDLRVLLAWAQECDAALRRLHASEPSLAEVFHEIRRTVPEEVPA